MVMKYLISTKEVFRVDTVEDAESLNKELKNDSLNMGYELTSFSYIKKQVKAKGEIVDEYVLCTAVKNFNDPKEPDLLLEEIKYIPKQVNFRNSQIDISDDDDLHEGQEEF